MIYIVSGSWRTGTSMMMRCLQAGGMELAYNKERNELFEKRFGDDYYSPNEGGLFEFYINEMRALGFPRIHDGKAVKMLFGGVNLLAVADYRFVFMRRHPEEVYQSYYGMLNQHPQIPREHYVPVMEDALEKLRNRKDVVSVDVFWYRRVCGSPLEHFKRLIDHGWPLDAEKAASEVKPELCRYKLENLEVGIV